MRKKGDSELTTALLGPHLNSHLHNEQTKVSFAKNAAIRDVQRKFLED